MDTATLFNAIVSTVGGILIAVIGYYLKRTISIIDRCEQEIKTLDEGKADKEDLAALKIDVEKRVDKLSRDIEGIKEDYITKEDFFREQAKTDRKLDMILDILLERKGGRNNNG